MLGAGAGDGEVDAARIDAGGGERRRERARPGEVGDDHRQRRLGRQLPEQCVARLAAAHRGDHGGAALEAVQDEVATEAAAAAGDQHAGRAGIGTAAPGPGEGVTDPVPGQPGRRQQQAEPEARRLRGERQPNGGAGRAARQFGEAAAVALVHGDHRVEQVPRRVRGEQQPRRLVEAGDAKARAPQPGEMQREAGRPGRAEGHARQVRRDARLQRRVRREAEVGAGGGVLVAVGLPQREHHLAHRAFPLALALTGLRSRRRSNDSRLGRPGALTAPPFAPRAWRARPATW